MGFFAGIQRQPVILKSYKNGEKEPDILAKGYVIDNVLKLRVLKEIPDEAELFLGMPKAEFVDLN